MGNKAPKEIEKDDYQECCKLFKDYFFDMKQKLQIENLKKDIDKKIDEKVKKTVLLIFIKHLLEKEKKERIINKIIDIFSSLFDQYEKIYRKKDDEIKKFSENVDNNEKNIINAIYISKILEDEIDDEDDKFMIMLFIYMVKIVLMKLKMETIKILMKILKNIMMIILKQQMMK